MRQRAKCERRPSVDALYGYSESAPRGVNIDYRDTPLTERHPLNRLGPARHASLWPPTLGDNGEVER